MPIFQDPDPQSEHGVPGLWSTRHLPEDRSVGRNSRPPKNSFETQIWDKNDIEMHYLPSAEDGVFPLDVAKLQAAKIIERIRRDHYSQSQFSPPNQESLDCVPTETSTAQNQDQVQSGKGTLASPANIERPRSALHSGDFREGAVQPIVQDRTFPICLTQPDQLSCGLFSSSPSTSWYSTGSFSATLQSQSCLSQYPVNYYTPSYRPRAPSLSSISSSYVLKAPTSPLVHQANNVDLDFSSTTDGVYSASFMEKANRRRTLPAESCQRLQSSLSDPPENMDLRVNFESGGREHSFSYHGHYPQRSLTTYTLQLASSVQTGTPRVRRPSFASEKSVKHHASLVGSYEESILTGRMSMNPSKPLNFTAQIGVLGKGKCKANLKCPPHVTVPFPAVFYSYPTSGPGRSISDDSPSPYVGTIDLENSLSPDDRNGSKRRKHLHTCTISLDGASVESIHPNGQDSRRLWEKKIRRSESPKSPPGGYYRIPQQGQLQIMIKNPNKTAVKLFLVPYDLSDMEPGTKTFIRQRSYSAGPVIDMPLSARTNLGADRPEASLNPTEDTKDKPILRYLIHLNICCPSKSRFYLYSTIRVVFANRVPDGKEKLRNEMQFPDPRYSPYKPNRDSGANTKLAIDVPHGRSSAYQGALSSVFPNVNVPDGPLFPHHLSSTQALPIAYPLCQTAPLSVNTAWFSMGEQSSGLIGLYHPPWALVQGHANYSNVPAENSHDAQTLVSRGMRASETPSLEVGLYNKLRHDDFEHGDYRIGSLSAGPEARESLLAKRLRNQEVHKPLQTPHYR